MHDPASNEAASARLEGQVPRDARNGNDNHSHLSLGDIGRNYEWLLFIYFIYGDRGSCKTGVRIHHTRQ